VGLLSYHIEQYIGVYGYHALESWKLLQQFMEWRNQKFEEKISYFQREELEIVAYYLQKKKIEGDNLYVVIQNSFNTALRDWEDLITTIRSDRDWDMKLWDDENFRRDFKHKVVWIENSLRKVNEAVEKLFSPELLPVSDIDKVPSRIRIFMDNILLGFKGAHGFFKEILKYVEKIERRLEERKEEAGPEEEGKEQQPVGPVGRAIASIRSLMQRMFPTRTGEEEEVSEHDNENDETTPG
jgi:hypothetical protein